MNIRINKYISEAGVASRRDADRLIESGRVRINGRAATLGDVVAPGDRVLVNGNPIESTMQRVYIAYNKPIGVTSTTEKSDPDNIIKAVAYHGGRIFPIGRLDKDSEGLILLTNDGDIINKILRVSNKHDKEYIVTVDHKITDEFLKRMASGVSILGIVTRKCKTERINDVTFRIILNQGLNRQIRRMCKVLGYKVMRLERIRIMNIRVDGISSGTWRFLNESEIDHIMKEISGSTNEPLAPKSGGKHPIRKAGKFTPDRPYATKGRGLTAETGARRSAVNESGKSTSRTSGHSVEQRSTRTSGGTAGKSTSRPSGRVSGKRSGDNNSKPGGRSAAGRPKQQSQAKSQGRKK